MCSLVFRDLSLKLWCDVKCVVLRVWKRAGPSKRKTHIGKLSADRAVAASSSPSQ
jgi:hypothetical protein